MGGAAGEVALQRVGGYVLAGGRSARMGTDKALVELAGRPLIAYATEKLRLVTGGAAILAGAAPGNRALAAYGRLVFDLHPGCGPAAGIEAALRDSEHEWNLILPVDLPFLPVGMLAWWVERTAASRGAARIAAWRWRGEVQPTVLLVHRECAEAIAGALAAGEYKLMRVLEYAARSFAPGVECAGEADALRIEDVPEFGGGEWVELWERLGPAERESQAVWFANLNTPEELCEAARHMPAHLRQHGMG